ncbi:MAG: uracil permease [Firmicutes bacterium]|nr:uracil permease [Bacillota bacterium]
MLAKDFTDVHEAPPPARMIPLSLQHLFAMFGATVLVPILTGLNPSVAILASGVGTLIYILCTQAKIPAYLGSSFAFIAPIIAVSAKMGPAYALGGGVAAGLVYVLVAALIGMFGSDWLNRLLPPAVVGAVVIVIGLSLAATAVDMATNNPASHAWESWRLEVAAVTLLVAVAASVFSRGFISVIPVLLGIIGGYTFAALTGHVDFTPVAKAAWFAVPQFTLPRFDWGAILLIAPVAIVTITEHIGHLLVTNNVVGRDFVKNPGLHRSLLGDGVATVAACCLGGPPNTTYGENIGVMAITRVYSVKVIALAAVFAIFMGFIGKFGALLQTIPSPVMGGISIMLFGVIAAAGLRMLVESGVDYADKRTLITSAVILVLGIGGAKITLGGVELSGVALATLAGVLLHQIFALAPRAVAAEERVQPAEKTARPAPGASRAGDSESGTPPQEPIAFEANRSRSAPQPLQ